MILNYLLVIYHENHMEILWVQVRIYACPGKQLYLDK